MGKKTPRRLKRFARQGIEPSDEAMGGLDENMFSYSPNQKGPKPEEKRATSKEIAAELAREEVQKFKEKHKRFPEKKEYNSISESIYAQLKDKKKRKKAIERLERKRGSKIGEPEKKGKIKRKHGRPVRGKERDEKRIFKMPESRERGSLSSEEIKGMSVEDLFSSEKIEKEKGEPGELEKIGGEEFSLEGLEDLEGKTGTLNKCQKCGTESKSIIFCPECGTAFCEKCAKLC